MDPHLDDRLPDLVEIESPNRQQTRRVTRKPTPCGRCHRPLTVDNLCFAAGHDAHRSCAVIWNTTILEAFEQLNVQDAEQAATLAAEEAQVTDNAKRMGLLLPSGSGLWTPPRAMPAAAGATA